MQRASDRATIFREVRETGIKSNSEGRLIESIGRDPYRTDQLAEIARSGPPHCSLRLFLLRNIFLAETGFGGDPRSMAVSAAPRNTRSNGLSRVTISDVAHRLGMSKGTISRALNDYSDISEATKQRVRREADRMGYSPLAHAHAIRTGRAKSIGLVLQIDEHDGQSPFLKDFLAGLTETTSDLGWTLTVACAGSDDEMRETMARLIEQRKVDGFVLPRTRVNDPRWIYLREQGVPSVLYGRTDFFSGEPAEGSSYYDISGEDAMADAVARLVSKGHQRIGFVAGIDVFNFTHLRLDGYRTGLAKAGIAFDKSLIAQGARTTEDGARAVESLLQTSLPPTAIIFSTDETALGSYIVARQRGLRIGQDVSIVAYDGIREGQLSDPSLATYKVDTRAAGSALIRMLIQQIQGTEAAALRTIVPATFVNGGSIGVPALGSAQLAARMVDKTDQDLRED